ncbi:Protein nud1 [Sporothrix epigloea]|uniref:Protein nud1 n=1 Tax=Sporothrix epigloea TaxID=1892477 RepID=A0ABP0DWL6_9PEZI
MTSAWLDSLSEDWVSQAGSEPLQSPTHSTRSKGKVNTVAPALKDGSVRIFGSVRNNLENSPSNSVLSEKSANELNMFGSRRRSLSLTSLGSVVHNTLARLNSTSPAKDGTPEWRRRLVQGDFAYGEQRDLFTSAKVGLESMFKPPVSISPDGTSATPDADDYEEDEEDDDVFSPRYDNPARSKPVAQSHSKDVSTNEHYEEYEPLQGEGTVQDMTMPSSPPIHAAHYEGRPPYYNNNSTMSRLSEPYRGQDLRTSQEYSVSMPQDPSEKLIADGEDDGNVRQRSRSASNGSEGSHMHYPTGVSRAVSGQSVLRNESFSAILISPEKDKAGNGAVFGALELPSGELKRRLENLRWNQMMLADDAGKETDRRVTSIGSKSLNVDNTEEYDRNGGFINFRRGGRSADGSFRDRMLSPPIANDTSEMLPEESLQASTPKHFASVRTEADTADSRYKTEMLSPVNSGPKKQSSLARQRQQPGLGGSPLKLFGPYDTFTNQTLMRRISQYEDQMSNGSRQSGNRSTSLDVGSLHSETAQKFISHMQKSDSSRQKSRQSSAQFGDGELDEFTFGDDTHLSRHLQQKSESRVTPVVTAAPSAAKVPVLATPRRVAELGSEGKRPCTSPSKDSTPKRRRTLHESDIAFVAEGSKVSRLPNAHLESVHASHTTMQSIISRKRRDARSGDEFQCADPKVLASRDILRLRTPTPNQRSFASQSEDSRASHGSSVCGPKCNNISRGSSAAWSDSAVANSLMPATGPVSGGDRKPSIRTEDFLNEAHKIMNALRSQGAVARGGLASLEESDLETSTANGQFEQYEDSFQESTKEPFSRPPSREGGPVPRVARMQEDPELVARLKKYAERSDLEDIVTTTTRSMGLAQSSIRAEREAVHAVNGLLQSRTLLSEEYEISDPPNIRISTNPERQDQQFGEVDENPTKASQRSVSSGPSSVGSIPTGSSRGSDTKKTIAPQTVSHLIPDQVGNMILDRDRNIWIKRRNGSGASAQHTQSIPSAMRAPSSHSILLSEGSEEDPFADIPDLSVDATMELYNLKPAVASPIKTTDTPGPTLFSKSGPMNDTIDASNNISNNISNADVSESVVEHEISIDQGRLTRSSSPTRKRHLAISFSSPVASIIQDFVVEDSSDCRPRDMAVVDHAAAASIGRGRRSVSVKFSSTPRSANGGIGDKRNLNGASIRSRSASRCSSRVLSVRGHEFVPRSVSRIDEREESNASQSCSDTAAHNQQLSLIGDRSELTQNYMTGVGDEISELIPHRSVNVSLLVTTPGPSLRADDEQLMAQCVGMLSLSPMSEFTIHQERSLAMEASYVLGGRHLVTGDNSKTVMAQSLHELVSRLTEVEPFEPYWEDMEELDVQGKNLETLHKLDEFCPQLVSLDVTGNSLRNLSGVPASVRQLRIVGNRLSELTSWTNLANLQYLDISNNDVKTLSGLKSLVHLRGLRADNCGLESLDGLRDHDALQTLRARDNQITSVDFEGTRLRKLVDLDLENNQITAATNMDQLTSLVTLNLRRNRLTHFAADNRNGLPHVRTLDLSDNQLTALDVRGLPALRVLFADRNRLARIRGFSKTPRLDSVSIREQQLEATERLDISCLYHAYEVRKLFLSGNLLDSFDPPVEFLNLQLLELANCGLTSLPATLGRRVPNLRTVNLNFNALTDLRSLGGIARLKKLLAAGNRLARAYATIETLAAFAHLAEVDLRNNPVTQGFYPSAQISMSISRSTPKDAPPVSSPGPFTLPRADVEQDRAYSSRLDLATGMRRRVYSQVLGDACTALKQFDGLPVNRALGDVRDAVWQALNAKGIVSEKARTSDGTRADKMEGQSESHWGAEDSFA